MYSLLLVVNVLCAVVMVCVILLQHGQGAAMGSSFGRGAQGSLIGVTGSANFLSRATSVLATVFFASALALSLVPQQGSESSDAVLNELISEDQQIEAVEGIEEEVPAVDETDKQ